MAETQLLHWTMTEDGLRWQARLGREWWFEATVRRYEDGYTAQVTYPQVRENNLRVDILGIAIPTLEEAEDACEAAARRYRTRLEPEAREWQLL